MLPGVTHLVCGKLHIAFQLTSRRDLQFLRLIMICTDGFLRAQFALIPMPKSPSFASAMINSLLVGFSRICRSLLKSRSFIPIGCVTVRWFYDGFKRWARSPGESIERSPLRIESRVGRLVRPPSLRATCAATHAANSMRKRNARSSRRAAAYAP